MKESKKELIINSITKSLDEILENLEDEQLDYFILTVTNHNGNLQVDHTIRERTKAY